MSIRDNHEVLSSIVENIIAGIGVFQYEKGQITPIYFNEGFYRMMGYTKSEMTKMTRDIKRSIIPEDLHIFNQGIKDILKDDGSVEFEFRTVTGSGDLRWLQVRGNLYSREGDIHIISAIILDATERKSVETELALQTERLNLLSESVQEQIIDYNAKTDVLIIKTGKLHDLHSDRVIHDFREKEVYKDIYFEDVENFKEVFDNVLKSAKSDTFDFRSDFFEDSEGEFKWYRATVTSVIGVEGYVTRVVGRVSNINDKKLKEIELEIKADKDGLSGLYNKNATTKLIMKALKKYNADEAVGAMMMLDLDNFKAVNDNLGHAMGDTVIEDVGKILQQTFKGKDVVGRIGGDEFMVFVQDLKTIEDAAILAKSLNDAIHHTYGDSRINVTISCSIGIAIVPKHGGSFEELYNNADQALYQIKNKGKNGYSIYNPENQEER